MLLKAFFFVQNDIVVLLGTVLKGISALTLLETFELPRSASIYTRVVENAVDK
jgi:hypothetical protein